MTRDRLPYDPCWIVPTVHVLKTATVRYDPDVDLVVGDRFDLYDTETGETFATARVTGYARVRLGSALDAIAALQGNYPTDDVDDLVESLRGYYDDPLTRDTVVSVFVYDVVDLSLTGAHWRLLPDVEIPGSVRRQ